MFRERISYKMITERILSAGWGRFDNSFDAVTEILLSNRIDTGVDFKIYNSYEDSSIVRVIMTTNANITFTTPRNIREFDAELGAYETAYYRDVDLEKYIKKNHKIKVLIYKNDTDRKSIVVLFKKEITAYHLMMSFFSKFYPWPFEEAPLTEDEINFLTAFQTGNFETVRDTITKFKESNQIDLLESLANRLRERRVKNLNDEINSVTEKIDDYNNAISRFITERRELHEKLRGIMTSEDEDPAKQFRDYLNKNSNVKMTSVSGSECTFEVYTKLSNINKEAAEVLYKDGMRNNSFCQVRMEGDKWLNAFKRIFIEKTAKLKICASYYIDLLNFRYGPRRIENVPRGYIPNPHIQDFRCIGDYYSMLNDAQNRGDIASMLMIMNVSAASVNLMEYPSARNLFAYISVNQNEMVCEDKNGNRYTPNEIGAFTDEEWAEVINRESNSEEIEETENG